MPLDLKLTEDFDLLFKDGDLVIGESSRQHQTLLLLSHKGEWREFPAVGVGLARWLNDEESGDLNARIKREFEADGMKIQQVKSRRDGNRLSQLQIEGTYA